MSDHHLTLDADACLANDTDSDEVLALLALLQVEGLGTVNLNRLLDHFGSARAVLAGDPFAQDLLLQALGPRARRNLALFLRAPREGGHWQLARQSLAWLQRQQTQILLRGASCFPALLREISDCPPLLFLRGEASPLNMPAIAIVGTRKPTVIGRRIARRLAAELAARGFLVCSGLALGIDAEAHRGALEAGAATAAVMATGIDTVYPGRHRGLAAEIVTNGLLLSEMPLGTPAVPGLFPRRNRLVSGLCLGVIVVEAGLPSGSLHTANFAAEQNREVFAVPGATNNPLARGCHQLLREGAHLVETVDDVLAVLGDAVCPVDALQPPDASSSRECVDAGNAGLPEHLQPALLALEAEPADFEQLCLRTGMPANELGAALVELELLGLLLRDGGRYCRVP
ncbi:MAG: DNA-processing protein DprA [Pseudomonadales bacterium]